MSFFSELIHHPKGAIEELGQDIGHSLGDAESAFSNITHGHFGTSHGPLRFLHTNQPWFRRFLFEAPALVAGPYAGAALAGSSTAGSLAADAAVSAGSQAAAGTDAAASVPDVLNYNPGTFNMTADAATAAPTAADATASLGPSGIPGGGGTDLGINPPLDPSQLYASADQGNPSQYTYGTNPADLNPYAAADAGTAPFWSGPSGADLAGPGPMDFSPPPADPILSTFQQPDISNIAQDYTAPNIDTPWWKAAENAISTPKGMLGAAGLGLELYGLTRSGTLPSAAKTALGAAGPAAAQAQQIIQTGGMGTPLWASQKSGIDAQVDQQIQNYTRSIQQNAANAGQGGANSMVVQQQVQTMTNQLEALRQQMYQAALQQNVQNAVAELTGANQTLMSVAQLQMAEDQRAQQILYGTGRAVGQLSSLFPG